MTAKPVKPPADSKPGEPSPRAIQRWENEGGAVERLKQRPRLAPCPRIRAEALARHR